MIVVQQNFRRRIIVKNSIIVLLSITALLATGCQKKEEPAKTTAPKAAVEAVTPQAAPQTATEAAAPQKPGDPHAALKPREIPAGVGHKGKVVQTMDAAGYTYVEVEEKGQKLWLAVMKTEVKKGDIVEFPDSPPMVNFESKTLKKTFDKIIFAEGLRVVK